MNRFLTTLCAAAFLLGMAAPLFAESNPGQTQIQEKQFRGIPYVTGGVGVGERNELESRMNDYNLHLIFALEEEGKYLGRVDVTVADSSGSEVLQVTTEGPWLLARLPEGEYTVRATTRGETQEKTVNITGERLSEVAVLY